jgi:hypothetical protein
MESRLRFGDFLRSLRNIGEKIKIRIEPEHAVAPTSGSLTTTGPSSNVVIIHYRMVSLSYQPSAGSARYYTHGSTGCAAT